MEGSRASVNKQEGNMRFLDRSYSVYNTTRYGCIQSHMHYTQQRGKDAGRTNVK